VAAATSRALSIDPSDRFSTLQEFSDALKKKRSPLSWRLRFLSSRAALTLSGVALLGILAMAAWARRGVSRIDESRVTLTKKSYVTNTGRVAQAAISPNGQTLAYVDVSCTIRACTYGVELKDVDGASSRRVMDDVNELFGPGITWSPDGRNILLRGRVNNKRGTILVSALGNVVRRVGPEMYSFWSGGDSLVFARRDSTSVHLIFSGLDGAPVDSLVTPVREEDAGVQVVPFPNSRWFAVRLPGRGGALWFSVDRQGRIGSRLPRTLTVYPRTSSDALWLAVPELTTDLVSIVRIPFDSATGRFGEHRDTVHTGSVSTMDVTPDGTKIAINETTAEFTGWALEMRDLAKGVLPQDGPLVTATSHLTFEISPNGRRILVGRRAGSAATGSLKWELIPFSGGMPIPLSGAPAGNSSLFWADSSNIGVWTSTPSGGVSLGVLSVETGQRHNEYSMTDSGWVEAVPLVGGGWAWNSLRSAVKVYRPGSRAVRTFPLPAKYPRIQSLAPSADGRTVAFTGVYRDSVRLSVLSLATGVVSQVLAIYGVGASFAVWLSDGSILFSSWENPDGGLAMYRVRPTGELVSITRVPVRTWSGSVSSDMKRATFVVRNYHGDVTLSNVARR
jgi:hypothetical protein